MGIIWIRESSPMTVVVEDDEGRELGRLEVEGVQARDADWQITEADESGDRPISGRKFRMRRRQGPGGEEHVLKLEFGENRGTGPNGP